MKRLGLLLLTLGISASAVVHPRARADEERVKVMDMRVTAGLPETMPGEVIVAFRDSADDRVARRLIYEAGGLWAEGSRFGRRYRVALDDGFTTAETIARLRGMPDVDYAEPVHMMHAFQSTGSQFIPNDSRFNLQWNFEMIHAQRMWAIQQGDPSVVVAIIDTGIAYENFGPFRKAPDWGDVVFVQGFNTFNGSSHANDDNFHGTHVASTVAEATNNSTGVAGLAFKCSLMAVKVLDRNGDGTDFQVAEGIDYAVNFRQGTTNPVKVINLSLGGPGTSETMRRAIDRAIANGITVVAAAGNENAGTVSFPASHASVIAVGALDGRKQRAPYSNFGADLDVMAPGGNVRRDDNGPGGVPDGVVDAVWQQDFDPDLAELGRYDSFLLIGLQGTSMASPHVAALAALLYRQGITDPRAIKAAIENTAEDLGTSGRDDQTGHGMIRPDLALAGYGLNR